MADYRDLPDYSKQKRNEQLERRMLLFAVKTIQALKNFNSIPRSVADQLTRSSGSVGANYAEACNASSKLDFRNKIYTSKKEAAESRYWIDLCRELTADDAWLSLRQEVQELILILQTIINSMKSGSAK